MAEKWQNVIEKALKKRKLSDQDVAARLQINLQKYGSLSKWTADKERYKVIELIAELDIVSELFPGYVKVKKPAAKSKSPDKASKLTPQKKFWRDKNVVFTGTLANFSKEYIIDLITNAGGSVTKALTPNTNLVIVGDQPSPVARKAKSMGIIAIDEAELVQKGLV